jgi:hypothetical protein
MFAGTRDSVVSKASREDPLKRRLLVSAVTGVTACALAVMGAQWLPAQAAPAVRTAAKVAPAENGAARGGNVLIVLRNQHPRLTLRARGAARVATTRADQHGIVAAIRASGGTDVAQLVSVNAVAAKVSAAEVARLAHNPAVAKIIPNLTVSLAASASGRPAAKSGPLSTNLCPAKPDKPLLEPEALQVMRYRGLRHDPDQAHKIATGKGVVVAIDGVNQIAGNPDLIRRDGRNVVIGSPTPHADHGNYETYGVASAIAGQGTVVYDYSKELPNAGLPRGCTFVIKGDAPGVSLIDASAPGTQASRRGSTRQTESQVIQGVDHAVIDEHADVIAEPFEMSQQPGQFSLFYAAYDAAVAAGVTVVAAGGDSGAAGPMSSPATDPNVIAVGASNSLGLLARAYGYTTWLNGNVSPLSSGEVAPDNRMVDLVAPGDAGEAICSPAGNGCPAKSSTQTFSGTGQAAAFVAGAAADVIQAYAATHHRAKPTPAVVKEILTGTAADLFAPQGQQGAGQVNIYAAVRAAQQMPGTTDVTASDAPGLIPSPTQIDVAALGGTTAAPTVTLYNASPDATTVSGTYRNFGAPGGVGGLVTEPVSAPDPSLPVPADGAQAAAPITFTVPTGLSRIQTDMLFPDPANNTILAFELISPDGQLAAISYDAGVPSTTPGHLGTGPDIQHAEIANPAPGNWTARIVWANGQGKLQSPPQVPGTYTGNITFQVTDRAAFVNTDALDPTVIPAHSSITVPLSLPLRATLGDQSTSVQFTTSGGATISLPVNRRTLIPPTGGTFFDAATSVDSDGVGQVAAYDINVSAGESNLNVAITAPDTSPDNPLTYYLIDPNGNVVAQDATPKPAAPAGSASLTAANPIPGQWEIDVELNQTVSGLESVQLVTGKVTVSP